MAISHWLAHGHQIWNEAVAGKPPHLFAGAAEAGLDFVGDEQAARSSNGFHRRAQEARRVGEDAVT